MLDWECTLEITFEIEKLGWERKRDDSQGGFLFNFTLGAWFNSTDFWTSQLSSTLCSSLLLHFILHIYSPLIFFMWIWENSSHFYSGTPFFSSVLEYLTSSHKNLCEHQSFKPTPLPLLQRFWITCFSLGISPWLYLQCLHSSKWISVVLWQGTI